jgi:hypothetical protein
MTSNPWHCDKCKKELPREQLSEIWAWGLYVCEPCIEAWIYGEK